MMMRAVMIFAMLAVASAVTLTPENFDSEIKGKNAIVKFFAPWCGHCKRMAPAWEQLEGDYKDHEKVVVGDVDCTQHRDLCSRFGIRGFPTLKAFKAGTDEPEDYKSGRSYDDLKKYITENLQ
eukprot:TRINITY_DN833_c0_g1_i1.p1 TRINITY_DN833_c0_g1~~TRINITY_DN833_c0_g1_i1.p1  ORF type:complete len:140 (+),score=55.06 TRINITY_DN833_c0_g1_i1:54-422(+)